MRLINVHDLSLYDFPADSIPKYAILSHTWTSEEVTFAEWSNDLASLKSRSGYAKVKSACIQADADGLDFLWADTCCIDKSSSAELSEAINSMYLWYRRAEICYAYLCDVPHVPNECVDETTFIESRWFTRGWCLQELLAPRKVEFFSAEWHKMGSKDVLRELISLVTNIDHAILSHERGVSDASVAERMSWAARRRTTRIEDMAYCLLGLFNVNMPLLYGEGNKAFRRLQEEIMKAIDDQTLFAWVFTDADPDESGLFAPHPRNFAESGSFINRSELFESRASSITSRGISCSVFLNERSEADRFSGSMYRATLKCTRHNSPDQWIGIVLVDVGIRANSEFIRVRGDKLSFTLLKGELKDILVRHETPKPDRVPLSLEYIIFKFSTSVEGVQAETTVPADQAGLLLSINEKGRPTGLASSANIHSTDWIGCDAAKVAFPLPLSPEQEVLRIKVSIASTYQMGRLRPPGIHFYVSVYSNNSTKLAFRILEKERFKALQLEEDNRGIIWFRYLKLYLVNVDFREMTSGTFFIWSLHLGIEGDELSPYNEHSQKPGILEYIPKSLRRR